LRYLTLIEINRRKRAPVLLPLADRIETITYDNGKEFGSHVVIATSLRSLSYFAKPYHSWERGLNEHTHARQKVLV
jgi:IS30 family transposase